MPTPKLSEAKRKRIRELASQGWSQDAIAESVGVGGGTVTNVAGDIYRAKSEVRRKQIEQLVREGLSVRQITVKTKAHALTVKRIIRDMKKAAAPKDSFDGEFTTDDDGLPPLPVSDVAEIPPFEITKPGRYLILSDTHFPQHDVTTIRLAVAESIRRNVVGIVLNGDILDCHEISRHDKDPRARRYVDELKMGQEFLTYLRGRFHKADIFYKLGNHEARLEPYIMNRAPAFEGLDCLSLQSALEMARYGVTQIDDKRIIHLGKLHVIHGHEYKGGGGVNPARWMYLKARSVALCGHFHRTSEHHARNIADRHEASWSLGCACGLKPRYMPLNDWNHGFAFVEIDRDGGFVVENKRVLSGKVV